MQKPLEDLNSTAYRDIGRELGRERKRPPIADPYYEDVETAPRELLDPWDLLPQQLSQVSPAERPRIYREYFEATAELASQVLQKLTDMRPA